MKPEAKRAARIGIFVFSAFALLIASLAVISTGTYFKESYKFVVNFDSSLKGLIVGAPVRLYGVQVGRVTAIQIVNDHETRTYSLPITIELDKDTFFADEGSLFNQEDAEAFVQNYIDNGLRAELQSASLVSGTLYIELSFLSPDKANAASYEERNLPEFNELKQIPTSTTALNAMLDTVANLPIEDLVAHVDQVLIQTASLLEDVNSLVNSGEISEILIAYTDLAQSITAEVNQFSELRNSLTILISTMTNTVDSNDENINELILNVTQLSQSADNFVVELGRMMNEDSKTMIELSKTMRLLQGASRSVGELADILTQNPESIIYGRE